MSRRRRPRRPVSVPADVLLTASVAGRCPDCPSEADLLAEGPPGVWGLVVRHDPSCPFLAAQERRQR